MNQTNLVTDVDICIYGATSAGITAAIQAVNDGNSVALIESGTHLGGLTTGGLGATDIGNKAAIGGLSRLFYERVYQYYEQPENWKWTPFQRDGADYRSNTDPIAKQNGRPTRWTFEPHVALKIYREMLAEVGVSVSFEQKLAKVHKVGARIEAIEMENGAIFRARIFIDCSYEGDLMALSGVSYHVGREANSVYGETLNGVRAQTPHHQFKLPVDPYIEAGNPASGLLPFIEADDGKQAGEGDHRPQDYNFRLCMTQVAENKSSWEAPTDYDERNYELLARSIEAHEEAGKPLRALGWGGMMYPVSMPNGKTDTNNSEAFSTDFIGRNYDYPDGDFATRARIWQEHENYTRGFLYFLATNERVPQRIRDEMNSWGLAKDEFIENNNWPTQLYVREARRMLAEYVITENDCRRNRTTEDNVGLAAYQMDSHNCRRIVKNGLVENEGDVQEGVSPYPISYRALTPHREQCENLLVPVCLGASHIAFGSIRMEPVFMILGQSAAIAAGLALKNGATVQSVVYNDLRQKLESADQILIPPSTANLRDMTGQE